MDYVSSAVFSGGAGGCQNTPGILGFTNGAKPDFCLSEFSYYYEHPQIWKAKYGAVMLLVKLHNWFEFPAIVAMW